MKVIYVIDSVTDINSKIQLLQNRFGKDIYYVVKANFVKIFQTYGYQINAIYTKNLPEVVHTMLAKSDEIDDVVYLFSSLKIDDNILNRFISAIQANSRKVVNVCPNYSFFEQMSNAAYNVYVKALFKNKDNLASAKMQYLPKEFVMEILASHFGNKLFEINPAYCKELYFEDKEFNNNLKTKTGFNKNLLVPIILALTLTIALFTTMVLLQGLNYIAILIFVTLYLLDIMLTIIYQCKIYVDKRFFDKD
jgi:hypothetical protein